MEDIKIHERYGQLESIKRPIMDKAEEYSKYTLPRVFTEKGYKAKDDLERTYTQGFFGSLCNKLSGKLVQAVLPTNKPFFKLEPSNESLDAVSQDNPDIRFEILKQLSAMEDNILREVNKSRLHSKLPETIKHLMITGNCLLEKIDDGYKLHNLKSYVVKRDYKGVIVELIIKEIMSYSTLPEDFKAKIDEDKKDEDIELYTYVRKDDKKYIETQEMMGEQVGKERSFKDIKEVYIDLRWHKIDGEDYGGSFIEDIFGSIIALEKATKILVIAIASGAKIVYLINPNGSTDLEVFGKAKNGQAISGLESDISVSNTSKSMNMQELKEYIMILREELKASFLELSIRNSERTTAFEVDKIALELEATLGGFYTSIAEDYQVPAVIQAMKKLKIKENKDIEVVIISGIQALNRSAELQKINALIQELQLLGQVVGAEQVAKSVNVGAITAAIVANSGTAGSNFLYSQGEMTQMEASAKQEQMSEQAVMSGANTMGAETGSAMAQQQQVQGEQ